MVKSGQTEKPGCQSALRKDEIQMTKQDEKRPEEPQVQIKLQIRHLIITYRIYSTEISPLEFLFLFIFEEKRDLGFNFFLPFNFLFVLVW